MVLHSMILMPFSSLEVTDCLNIILFGIFVSDNDSTTISRMNCYSMIQLFSR